MIQTAARIHAFRGLLSTLVGRELKARYRGSVLGFFWSLANPLLLLAVYTVVFGLIFKPPRAQMADPYALFLICGLFPWVWVSTSLLEGTLSLITNAGLIRKAVFPVEVLPLVPTLANLVQFLLALPILAAALLAGRVLGHPVGGWEAVLVPLVILLQLPLVGGLALGLAALNAHFKDVKDILTNLLTLLFFLTPILYPMASVDVPYLRQFVRWANPFTPYTLAYQSLLFRGALPDPVTVLQMVGWAVLGWVFGAVLHRRLADTLVEAV